jgi:undecaprenyl-phosphate 4-deoxy-4-formamido-L-arabinose transferase
MNTENIKISVVLPVFNEASVLEELYNRLSKAMEGIGEAYEIVFVDDGSRDNSLDILQAFQGKDERIKVIALTRNFGQHAAVLAGLNNASGDIVVTMDSDLQNPPEEIPKLLDKLNEGYEAAAGWRVIREDSLFRRIGSFMVNMTVQWMTGVKLHDYGCMMRAYKRGVIDKLLLCHESFRSTPVLVSWLGVSIGEVKIAHAYRKSGNSSYNFLKLFKHNWDVITGFSIAPLQIISLIGFLMSIIGFAMGIYLLILRIFLGNEFGVRSIIALIFFFFGILILGIGIIGEYIGRIYIETKRRPHYIIKNQKSK